MYVRDDVTCSRTHDLKSFDILPSGYEYKVILKLNSYVLCTTHLPPLTARNCFVIFLCKRENYPRATKRVKHKGSLTCILSGDEMWSPALTISKGQTEDIQCRRGGQLSVIEQERINAWKIVCRIDR